MKMFIFSITILFTEHIIATEMIYFRVINWCEINQQQKFIYVYFSIILKYDIENKLLVYTKNVLYN